MKRLFFSLVALILAAPLHAQNNANQNQSATPTFGPNQSQLRLVVVDQTGAGVPAATITVTPKGGGTPITFVSDERGLATSPILPVGDVMVKVEFPGFNLFEAPLTLRRGAQNQVATLLIEGFKQEEVVSDVTTGADAARSTSSFTLTQDEIDALPDDPDELAEYLSMMAGPGGATFFMNGFSGGRLPNRDQIRSIRFRQNNFAADNHDAGRTQIDIVTRPNTSWGGNVNTNFGSDTFNARQPQQAVETPFGDRQVQLSVRGPIKAGRTSFSFNVNASNRYNSNPIIAVDRFGTPIDVAARSTNEQTGFQAGLEHSLNNNHGIYFNFQRSNNEAYGQGVGSFTLPERATTRFGDSSQLRFRLQGIFGGTKLNEFRVQWINQGNETFSVTDGPTYNVQDASNFGGAGVNSHNSTNRVEVADNFDFNVGTKHQMRAGFIIERYWVSSLDERNRAGTWTWSSLVDYNLERPRQFTQRVGSIDLDYKHYQGGFYWSDEFRLHRDLSVGFGVRNEFQAHIDDKLNLMPRAGFSWAPFGSQRAAVRGGYGVFYDWYESSLYEQTLRVDGVKVRDVRVTCGIENDYCANGSLSFDPLAGGAALTAGGRIQASENLDMPRVHQASIGYDRQLTPSIVLQTNYQILRGTHTIRSINVNAPVNGVRPNADFGDITQFESTGKTHSDRFTLGTQFRYTLFQQQAMVRVNYTLAQEKNYTDGSTSLPSDSQNPDVDWGPSRQDIRHQMQVQGQVPFRWGFRVNPNLTLRSGSPYNITTGLDDNNDGTFNDRPLGIGRNAARGESYWMFNLTASKRISLASLFTPSTPRGSAGNGALFAQQGGFGGGGGQGGFGGGTQGGFGGPNNRGNNNNNQRYNLELQVRVDNVFNHVTKTGYTGNLRSPYFGDATGVGSARQMELSLRFNF